MKTTKLSSKDQVITSKGARGLRQREVGLELQVIDTSDDILLQPTAPFPEAALDEIAGLLKERVRPKTDRKIKDAVARCTKGKWSGDNYSRRDRE